MRMEPCQSQSCQSVLLGGIIVCLETDADELQEMTSRKMDEQILPQSTRWPARRTKEQKRFRASREQRLFQSRQLCIRLCERERRLQAARSRSTTTGPSTNGEPISSRIKHGSPLPESDRASSSSKSSGSEKSFGASSPVAQHERLVRWIKKLKTLHRNDQKILL